MAAYNAEMFVERAIDSVLSQRDVEIELLVVDDASTDSTVSVVNSACNADGRIKLIRLKQNGGPAVARNEGFRAASGSWVAVLDADDAYRPDRLKTLLDIAKLHKADVVADNFMYFNPATQKMSSPALKIKPDVDHLSLVKYLNGARPFSGDVDYGLLKPMFKKEFLEKCNISYPINVRHGEDFEIVLACLRMGAQFYVCRVHSLYIYTGRESGWSKTKIDYSGQILRARAAASELDLAAQPEIARALELRASSLERLQLDRAWREKRSRASFVKGLQMDLASPTHWRDAARRVKCRLLNGAITK